jgi:hypothetical protein
MLVYLRRNVENDATYEAGGEAHGGGAEMCSAEVCARHRGQWLAYTIQERTESDLEERQVREGGIATWRMDVESIPMASLQVRLATDVCCLRSGSVIGSNALSSQ